MEEITKTIETQRIINEAVNEIIKYFGECGITDHMEQMLDAQTQIIGLMQIAKEQPDISRMCLEGETDRIQVFLWRVKHYLDLLKPIIQLNEDARK